VNPDVELIARSIARDARAFGDLFDRHSTAVYRFAYSLTHNEIEAQELVQETFITIPFDDLIRARASDDTSEHRDELDWVMTEVRKLGETDQRIVELCLFEGRSYKEAALQLGLSVSGVTKRVERTRTRLRAQRDQSNRDQSADEQNNRGEARP
jgi:DNA-directed RNA polymerase specialized sigma24 family protein